MEQRNLFGEAERIAARTASASTRRQYSSSFRAFGNWLAGELGRPPVVGDLDTDAVAAYARHLASAGGRGGRPVASATSRVCLSMIRALALDREDQVEGVHVPRHEPGPPETLTDTDYANLPRVPDRRTLAGKRDDVLLRVLGDCGCVPPSSQASARVICAVPVQTPATIACSCAARAAASARSLCPWPCRRRSRRG